ncbi:acetylornithine deacetylase/succinyl-diaminopimelate desuccinylase-like protein [Jatrophihabitans sp. GAS493]|uniref:M20/M25/M40 family metallo-hydrolase n=1 Tax=Jatrophihabitans sp. GAS493 TaxID=1907575 RepID=UPI000BB978FB|nr:M20/M25/M40 family metallo-hydrolase [Jatrophihabitans sp. GAS493]SOD73858.1 acetylornithine deacetylase/succinyl-diaminopimelate desuccinylase-like protein [Jatrophihabitans sp. GAS493]
MNSAAQTTAEDEVADLLSDLIAINTSNPTHPERPAAEWVAEKLAEVGIESQILEAAPGRASTIARISGEDSSRAPLLIHGHLDVVPAEASEWSVDPFAGEIRDGYVWGRGAVDMKDMDAMTLAVVREWARTGRRPPRDIVLAFVSDEEAGGTQGAHWLVDNHPGLFADCSEAISEVGGFSVTMNNDLRLYLIQTAEKGLGWLRLRAQGRPGHGSMIHDDNTVTKLAAAVSRIGAHEFPITVTDTLRRFLEDVAKLTGLPIDPDDPQAALPHLGGMARMIGATLRNTANPTMLSAGYKANVIPSTAEATIDTRFLPGFEDELMAKIDELAGPGIEREFIHRDIAVETSFDGAVVDAMAAALRAEDPAAQAVPYLMSGGTDAKSFSTLGIRCFGFAPLRLPPDLDFSALFHGIDERVPVDGLQFGVRVLDRFLSNS